MWFLRQDEGVTLAVEMVVERVPSDWFGFDLTRPQRFNSAAENGYPAASAQWSHVVIKPQLIKVNGLDTTGLTS